MTCELEVGGDDRARRRPAPPRRAAVRAQRHRLPPRHLPRPRRHRRGVPRLRGRHRDPDRVVRRHHRGDVRDRSAARQDQAHASSARRSSRPRTTRRRRTRCKRAVEQHPRRAQGPARGAGHRRASCSSASASSSAPCTTSSRSSRWGFCSGIENYSRHLSGRAARRAAADPDRLLPRRLPAVRRRVAPDRAADRRACSTATASRKETLVEYGFRLPSAIDNRPLRFDEWRSARQAGDLRLGDARRLGAGRGPGRRRRADHPADRAARSRDRGPPGRPTRSTTCSARSASASRKGERVLVTTLTKRMAEDLTEYYARDRRQGALPALRHRHARAHPDHPRPAPRRVRRARRHQPAARGPRHPRGVAGRASSTPTRKASCARRAR